MMRPGYIYILSNESMPGLVKIGRSKNSGASRLNALHTTGVPTPFKLEFEIFIQGDHVRVEQDVHEELEDHRVTGREFFKIEVSEAVVRVTNVAMYDFDHYVEHADLIPDPSIAECTGVELEKDIGFVPAAEIISALEYIELEHWKRAVLKLRSHRRRFKVAP